jgi:hypothetical protein
MISKEVKKALTPWTNVPKNILDYQGFVYLITNKITDEKYIGRKYLVAVRKKKVAGKKRKLVERKESDWKKYKSSSKRVQEAIHKFGLDNFEFKILECYKTRGETNFAETELLFKKEVLKKRIRINEKLEIYEWYNDNIISRYFRKKSDAPERYILNYNRYIINELKKL